DAIYDARRVEIRYTAIPKHPAIERDFSFVCDETVEAGSVAAVIKAANKLVANVELFDIYRGPQIGEGKKSMSYAVMLRGEDKTLTDTEADEAVAAILGALETELGVKLR
ncbi:MAG: phenylalanine--tRNA ligase subunit beta, partial [Clostridia bacterium]|nr:phenylalanine--tRNA ligase subunit beta [Clostridia bacterium]